MQRITLFWFRRDLRLVDNHGLSQALQSGNPVLPIFIFDRNILDELEVKADARLQFIFDTLEQLNHELAAYGSGLKTYFGTPEEVFRELVKTYLIELVIANRDYEPYAIQRDKSIHALLSDHGILFKGYKDQVIMDRRDVMKADGEPYTVFTPYSRKWKELFRQEMIDPYPVIFSADKLVQMQRQTVMPLAALGFKPVHQEFPAKKVEEELIRDYQDTRNFPGIHGTSRLSVHLRFGTISIRYLVGKAFAWSATYLNELIWREFYMMILYHFPHVVNNSFRPQYDHIPWLNREDEFDAWCQGRTGYPIVDAGMHELNETGFMHNRVRMITASFLTKHLLIDWRWGEAYFAQKLLDYELASNNGGWQWAAGSGVDAAPYFRIFNPALQTQKFDPHNSYLDQWVPGWQSPDYPVPIVDHKAARDRAIATFRNALNGLTE
ncbi:MAG TPA: deoxyribodipyrimidine photo-lyase [Saprospiraceae bacterium]|nr:deoxyribodipyrimidine photo-lyase [Saprospiraceae bacterium]HRV84803.1 deoxyribodipyrimidine photo-lyase [Saprospiraceae bacterium]